MKLIPKLVVPVLVVAAVLAGSLQTNRGPVTSDVATDRSNSAASWVSYASVDEMFARADVVVRAQVLIAPKDRATQGYLVTETTMLVIESFKGKYAAGDQVLLHEAGSMAAADAEELPIPKADTQYLLFLSQQFEGQPQHYILGPQGIFVAIGADKFQNPEWNDPKTPLVIDPETLRRF